MITLSLNSSSALVPTLDITQTPDIDSVTTNNNVKVSVTITSSLIDDNKDTLSFSELRYLVNEEIKNPIICDLSEVELSDSQLTINFVLGKFELDSVVEYTIYLEFLTVFDFESKSYSFTVGSFWSDSSNYTIYIIIAIVVFFALVSIITFKKRKK
jgi:hypothetical protein